MNKALRGFTIVELLVVVVVISLLATIAVVGFSRYQIIARDDERSSKATILSEALEKYYDNNGEYPSCPSMTLDAPTVANSVLTGIETNTLKTPSSTTEDNSVKCTDLVGAAGENDVFAYVGDGSISCTSGPACLGWTLKYKEENTGTIKELQSRRRVATAVVLTCPAGYIVVPGSSTYNTSDFCVMKYEAKKDASVKAVSQASGSPWTNISQLSAISASQSVTDCPSCHLITEAERLTIVQNLLGVASNWSGGTVGSGYIYSGHNDNSPSSTLAANTNDANGYSGTGNGGSSNQRRTLTLTNGEVIWDLAGNAKEWSSGQNTGAQPGTTGETDYEWKEWNATTTQGNITPSPFPLFGTPAAGSWTSAQGIGMLDSYSGETALTVFTTGGGWGSAVNAGICTAAIDHVPSYTSTQIGFRVAR